MATKRCMVVGYNWWISETGTPDISETEAKVVSSIPRWRKAFSVPLRIESRTALSEVLDVGNEHLLARKL